MEEIVETKICYKCGEEKDINLFIKYSTKGRATYGKPSTLCKKCKGLSKKESGARTRHREKRRNTRCDFIFDYLVGKHCMDCKIDNILVLEFDHREGEKKHKAVTKMALNVSSVDRILEEISKCDIVCSNCHTIRTMRRGNHRRYRAAIERGLINP